MLVGQHPVGAVARGLAHGGIYLAIGIFHWVFRKRFLEISIEPRRRPARGISVRLWDFLFYASFGFVVTRSVAIAGVLLVFCYLIVPSVGAMLMRDTDRAPARDRLGDGRRSCRCSGMYLSVVFDLPTGATIVCTFGLALILMAGLRPIIVRRAG